MAYIYDIHSKEHIFHTYNNTVRGCSTILGYIYCKFNLVKWFMLWLILYVYSLEICYYYIVFVYIQDVGNLCQVTHQMQVYSQAVVLLPLHTFDHKTFLQLIRTFEKFQEPSREKNCCMSQQQQSTTLEQTWENNSKLKGTCLCLFNCPINKKSIQKSHEWFKSQSMFQVNLESWMTSIFLIA